jgi:hypothetical protein
MFLETRNIIYISLNCSLTHPCELTFSTSAHISRWWFCDKPCMASSMVGPRRNKEKGYNPVAFIFFMGIGSLFQSQQSRKRAG